jgi:glycerol kinase
MNTGQEPIPSTHGLLTTIAYQIASEPIQYALEGSVSHSGSTIQWLRDKLQIIDAAPDTEDLSPEQNDGLYFVPAFSGLFCPHWRSDARACLVGLTTTHHKGHVCRAALEAAAYQTKEVLQAMEADSGVALADLKVDGGATNNRLLMQFQCDMLNVPVIQPVVMETTSLGAAYAAGLAVGVWQSTAEVAQLWAVAHTYTPQMEEATRRKYFAEWKKAVSKSLGWVEDNVPEEADAEEHKKRDLVFDMEQTGVSSWTPSSVAAAAMASLMIGFLIGRIRRS